MQHAIPITLFLSLNQQTIKKLTPSTYVKLLSLRCLRNLHAPGASDSQAQLPADPYYPKRSDQQHAPSLVVLSRRSRNHLDTSKGPVRHRFRLRAVGDALSCVARTRITRFRASLGLCTIRQGGYFCVIGFLVSKLFHPDLVRFLTRGSLLWITR